MFNKLIFYINNFHCNNVLLLLPNSNNIIYHIIYDFIYHILYVLHKVAIYKVATLDIFLGTPGTGKSTLATELAELIDLKYQNITNIAKEGDFFLSYDDEYNCQVLDEDKVRRILDYQKNSIILYYLVDIVYRLIYRYSLSIV